MPNNCSKKDDKSGQISSKSIKAVSLNKFLPRLEPKFPLIIDQGPIDN